MRPRLSMTGAAPSSSATRAPSIVADIASTRSSGAKCRCASSANARPTSACRLRSWYSSNSTAAMPSSAGSLCSIRVNTPSVTTSMRVRLPTRVSSRMRKPTVSPTRSPSVAAMRSATARVASRRGSSITMRLPRTHGSSSNASGTTVLLPAPGGATTTALLPERSAAASGARASSIGRPDCM